MSFLCFLIDSAEKPKRSFRWGLVSVRQQIAIMQLCSQRTQPKNNVQSLQQKHQEKISIDFNNNIKNIRTTSPDSKLFARGNCPEPCLGQFFLEYTSTINQGIDLAILWHWISLIFVITHLCEHTCMSDMIFKAYVLASYRQRFW